ncbi:hypothetical protein SDC9_196378 [bioreactor metagenome]|uniref:Uncharacterized protein n=1 Tax=bioreactor metagenome TaxID=1076179 RepID=A0A645ICY1_9ZZZZ
MLGVRGIDARLGLRVGDTADAYAVLLLEGDDGVMGLDAEAAVRRQGEAKLYKALLHLADRLVSTIGITHTQGRVAQRRAVGPPRGGGNDDTG